jgi:replicative superfamily II helicase
VLMNTNINVLISAPMITGQTVLFNFALLKQYEQKPRFRAAYLAPIKCLCQHKKEEWKEVFK